MNRINRFRAFVSDDRYNAMVAGVDYIMEEVQPGEYMVKVTLAGTEFSAKAVLLLDQWHPR